MTKFKKLLKLVLCTAVLTASVFGNVAYAASNNFTDTIIHAGGVVNNDLGTNSLEALKNSFCNGYRFIELDFNFTTDGHLVCIHDWDENYFGEEYKGKFKGAVSLAEFKNQKIMGKYTPVTMDNLQQWIIDKPETYIITDIKSNNIEGLRYIRQNYPALAQRVIPQIYKENEYAAVKSMGYSNIIYTLYAQSYAEKTNTARINSFAVTHNLQAIVFDKDLATEEYVSRLKKSGVRLFTHTVNDKASRERFKSMGISGVYSDVFL